MRLSGDAINHLTPSAAVGGELLRVSLLKRFVPAPVAFASVGLAAMAQFFAQLLFILLGIPFLAAGGLRGRVAGAGIALALILALAIAGLIYLVWRGDGFRRLQKAIERRSWLPAKWASSEVDAQTSRRRDLRFAARETERLSRVGRPLLRRMVRCRRGRLLDPLFPGCPGAALARFLDRGVSRSRRRLLLLRAGESGSSGGGGVRGLRSSGARSGARLCARSRSKAPRNGLGPDRVGSSRVLPAPEWTRVRGRPPRSARLRPLTIDGRRAAERES